MGTPLVGGRGSRLGERPRKDPATVPDTMDGGVAAVFAGLNSEVAAVQWCTSDTLIGANSFETLTGGCPDLSADNAQSRAGRRRD